MQRGFHHFHLRKRVYRKLEKYPSKDRVVSLMDNLIYFFVIIGPIMTLPQVYKIWVIKNAAGVSLITWATYFIASIFWMFYGIIHKEKPIIITNILWIIMHFLIVLGVVIYG